MPSGIATDDSTKHFFQDLVKTDSLESYFDFENKELIFEGVAPVMRFCLLSLRGLKCVPKQEPSFVFFAQKTSDVKDTNRLFKLDSKSIDLINPNTGTCPIFKSAPEAYLAKHMYRRTGVLLNKKTNTNNWNITFRQGLFNMTSDSACFTSSQELLERGFKLSGNCYESAGQRFVPLLEAKLLQQYDHRHGTFEGLRGEEIFNTKAATKTLGPSAKSDPAVEVIPRYWVDADLVAKAIPKSWTASWFVAFRDIIQPMTNARCAVFGVVPRVAISNNMPLLFANKDHTRKLTLLLANFNSFVFDFATRQKIGGTHLNFYIVEQLPTVSEEALDGNCIKGKSLKRWIQGIVIELTYTAWDLEPFAIDCGYDGPPLRWDEDRRFLLRAELDAVYFHLYLGTPEEWGADNAELREMFPTPRHAVEYIMDTFPIVKRKDIARTQAKNEAGEVVRTGTFITKETILEIYDEMATGVPYKTRLNPPPGPPTDAHGNFIPMAEWDVNNWPSHIHQPRTRSLIREETITDIMLLLNQWDTAVHVSAIELGVLFMRDDRCRKLIIDEIPTQDQPKPAEVSGDANHLIEQFDLLYYEMSQGDLIEPIGANAYRIKDKSAIEGLSSQHFERAREAVEAISKFGRPQETIERLRRSYVSVAIDV